MIEKTTSMDLYRDKLMCGGNNSLIKVIDLDSLSLVSRLPKPPPLNKENIAKDFDEDEAIVCYDESEDFPQCVGVKTIGTKFNQFIITLYENLTMFIWRPEPTIAAMRSIITHRSSIKLIKILDEINEMTFFGTLSSDSTGTHSLMRSQDLAYLQKMDSKPLVHRHCFPDRNQEECVLSKPHPYPLLASGKTSDPYGGCWQS